jgi:hypothetical protein
MRDTADGCCMYCTLPQDETIGSRFNEEQREVRASKVSQAILTLSSQVGQKGMQRMNSAKRIEDSADRTRERQRESRTQPGTLN